MEIKRMYRKLIASLLVITIILPMLGTLNLSNLGLFKLTTQVYATGVLDTPSVTVSGHTSSTVTISWGAVTNANRYYVKMDNGSQITLSSATSYQFTGISPGQSHVFYVQACQRNVYDTATIAISGWGSIAYTIPTPTPTPTPTPVDTQAPSAPGTPSPSTISKAQMLVVLNWGASTDNVGVAGYYIYRNGTQIASASSTSYTDRGLSANTNYTYYVKAYDAAGNASSASGSNTIVIDTQAPSAPGTPALTPNKTNMTISLSWSGSTDNVGVTGYYIYRNGVQIGSASSTSYTDSGLSANTSYSYYVCAYDALGNPSPASGSNTGIIDTQAPSTPGTPSLTLNKTNMTISLSWSGSTDNIGVAGYYIYRNGTQIASTSSTSHTDTGLSANTNYTYYVKAYDAAGNLSSASGSNTGIIDTQAPSAPGTPSPSTISRTQLLIVINWSASTDNVGVAGYYIYRNGTQVGSASSTSYTDTGLAANTNYTYCVKAYDTAGNVSSASGSNTIVIDTQAPSTPGTPSLTPNKTNMTMLLSWTGSTDNVGVSGYYIYRNDTQIGSTSSTSYTDSGLLANTNYTYYVKAYDAGGYLSPASGSSIGIIDTQAPTTPGTPTLTPNKTNMTMSLSWSGSTDNAGVAGYYIYRNDTQIGSTSTTSYTDTGLSGNTNYTYYIKAYDAAGNLSPASGSNIGLIDTQAPSSPGTPSTSTISKAQLLIVINWSASTDNVGVAGYYIYRDDIQIASTSSTSYTDKELSANTYHEYYVKAYDAVGNVSSASGTNTIILDTLVPSIPGTPTLTPNKTNMTMYLNWSGSTDNVGVTGYYIYRNDTLIGSSSTTNYTDTGLSPNTNYSYYIYAYDALGNISPPSGSNIGIIDTQAPSTPGTPTLTPNKTNMTMSLNWSGSTDNVRVAGYYIYRNGTQIGSSSTTSYTDTGLSGNTNYTYYVKAYDAAVNVSSASGSNTGIIDTQAPTIPGTPSPSTISKAQLLIVLDWSGSTDNVGVAGYYIYRDDTQIASTSSTSYTDKELSANTYHKYYVKAYDAAGNVSTASGTKEIILDTQAPSKPGTPILTPNNTNMTILLNWTGSTDNVGVTEYYIYRNDILIGSSSTTNYTDTGLLANTDYSYYIYAYDALGNISIHSDPSIGIVPLPIPLCSLESLNNGQIVCGSINVSGWLLDLKTVSKIEVLVDGNVIGQAEYGDDREDIYNLYPGYNNHNSGFHYYLDLSTLTNGNHQISTRETASDGTVTTIEEQSKDIIVDNNALDYMYFGNDGVYPATGNYSRTYTDFSITSPEFDLPIMRIYNSKDTTNKSQLGTGWTLNIDSRVTSFDTSFVENDILKTSRVRLINMPDGSTHRFVSTSNPNVFTAYVDGVNETLEYVEQDLAYKLTTSKYLYTFDTSNRLLEMKDIGTDYKITIGRNASGLITSITDSAGRVFTFNYTNSLLTSIKRDVSSSLDTTPTPSYINSTLVTYIYASGKLNEVLGEKNQEINSYAYNSSGVLEKVFDEFGYTLETISYQSGRVSVLSFKDEEDENYTYSVQTNNTVKTQITKGDYIQVVEEDIYHNILASTEYNGSVSQANQGSRITYDYSNVENSLRGAYFKETEINGSDTSSYTYIRDGRGNITSITNPDGTLKTFGYNSDNTLSWEKDEGGNGTFYFYINHNLMKKATQISTAMDYKNDGSDNDNLYAITTYQYYGPGFGNGSRLLYKETDPVGNETCYTYDEDGNITSIKDGEGNVTTYKYDDIGQKIEEQSPNQAINNSKTEYKYDSQGNLLKVIRNGTVISRTVYDAYGRVVQEIGPRQYHTTYDGLSFSENDTYSDQGVGTRYLYYQDSDTAESGKIHTITDPFGTLTTKVYDQVTGNQISETVSKGSDSLTESITYNPDGTINIETRRDGSQYHYEYDYEGRTTKLNYKAPNGSSFVTLEEYAYDEKLPNGQSKVITIKHVIDKGDVEISSTYNYAGKLLSQTTSTDSNVTTDDATISNSYYDNGLLYQSSDANGGKTTNYYDNMGNLLEVDSQFDSTHNSITSYTYYKNGLVKTEGVTCNLPGSAAEKQIKEYTYDKRGLLVMVALKKDNTYLNNYTQYYYDADGNKVRMYTGLTSPLNISGLDSVSSTGDNKYATTKYIYDADDQIKSVIDTLGKTITYNYNVDGSLESTVDNIHTTSFGTDLLGRVTAKEIGTDTQNPDYSYSYDAFGNMSSMSGGGATSTFTYTPLGQISTESMYGGSVVKSYQYDVYGNCTEFKITVNSQVKIDTLYECDKLGRLEIVKDKGSPDVTVATYTYDKNGNRSSLTYNQTGNSTTYSYNKANLLTSLVNKQGSTVISQFDYTYYLDGNQRTKVDSTGTTTYTYDGMGRLSTVTEPGNVVTSYQYNDYSDRSSMTITGGSSPSTTTYNYDSTYGVKLLSETNSVTGTTNYGYDGNGNETSKGGLTYTYDGYNQLATASKSGMSASYQYDASGLRSSKTVNGVKTIQIWDGDQLVLELNSSFGVINKYIRGINLIYSEDSSGIRKYYMYNGHGDVVQLTNSSGAVVKSYSYDAFGNEKNIDDGDTNPFRYCGEYFDKETGTIYLRARSYDPANGRFTSEDSYAGEDEDPLSLNLFTYCSNEPIDNTDPTGHWGMADHNKLTVNSIKSINRNFGLYWDANPGGTTPYYSKYPDIVKLKNYHGGLKTRIEILIKTFNMAIKYKNSKANVPWNADFFKTIFQVKGTQMNKDINKLTTYFKNLKYGNKTKAEFLLGLSLHLAQDLFSHCSQISKTQNGPYYEVVNAPANLNIRHPFEDSVVGVQKTIGFVRAQSITYNLLERYKNGNVIHNVILTLDSSTHFKEKINGKNVDLWYKPANVKVS